MPSVKSLFFQILWNNDNSIGVGKQCGKSSKKKKGGTKTNWPFVDHHFSLHNLITNCASDFKV